MTEHFSSAPARSPRFTPERRQAFLAHLAAGLTVSAAAAEIGITTAVVYQRRTRDLAFASAMDAALRATSGQRTKQMPVTQNQWEVFFTHLATGVAMRQAALAAGIRPEAVYDRRRTDKAFACRTDRLRGTSR
ncbi:hypothetical protein ABZ128_28850 [Streptomyces sp. NPDC006326]|uniref:hypothetical protein n=1 Tax=Streptomyces sp. NPDC006326 TaxID=3156752 RepID=UPI0033BA5A93